MTIIPKAQKKGLVDRVLFAESMTKHTTIRIGGKAELLIKVQEPNDIIHWSKYSLEKGMPLTVMGNGSNLLVSDEGIKGTVLKIYNSKAEISRNENIITVFSGFPMGKLISQVAFEGLGGIENLAGIPGTIGGAVIMNAGARGCEIGPFVHKITVLDLKCMEKKTLAKGDIEFSYRYSSLQNKGLIILEIDLKLEQEDPRVIKERIKKVLDLRKGSQPINFPNSGSVFKNPPNLSAGRLIDEVGLKGFRVGDAQIAEKHGNFIINLGDARALEVMELINIARKKVFDRFKVRLEPEIEFLGGGLKLEEV